jgi:HNH endonuclease
MTITRETRVFLFDLFGGRCCYCGFSLSFGGEKPRRDYIRVNGSQNPLMVPDHLDPQCRGGSDDWDNLMPSCEACNSSKAALNWDEFRLIRGLRARDLNNPFAVFVACPQRDWIICHSPETERALFLASFPDSARFYARGRIGAVGAVQQ